jgi:hypothetical protein
MAMYQLYISSLDGFTRVGTFKTKKELQERVAGIKDTEQWFVLETRQVFYSMRAVREDNMY